ncbi:MAG TPA: bifunctional phosphoribosylaminoimidazolecarboxamide formyltransferase/IMP cyclohydrolase [Verrucomicrobiota bacterium]|jgi:phosphoribosylaminoimidazolecarboxamide formyltransferase/IMP cyclohydrolase|nr:MAG: Bifunctional purine biosynthesis protein PurH [Verrucomicrobia bacterium ADurb.Bin063]HNW08314.1 bifunctional phosphoribosylaminoimidazolecarboxamide formyltransferase/IMP cyclohydrolase [Verrucomicrobiota bacterium]HNZ76318.1 bifunctional phosphoribosylaminoimidazolecarboxamide formyltransferase/IMP cyclohydrolase [Verrucomicrobiota bacterium]HOH40723.1 bifunctional phosphoribosylaminoimidazolecarboxamide formyltransferase/IMP cyclohydrolase [Verrucomicrobiota bacterium]HOX63548.1 bifu
MEKIRRALLSVSDKTGLVPLAQALARAGIELISTGGTAKALREAGLPVVDLSSYTGFPEMLEGRVKTLHPRVHGGLLYIRGNEAHEAAIRAQGIQPIDMVVVNLYPFEETVARPQVALPEAIENIDIGGPSMLRSAAKNHESVTVVVDAGDYSWVARQIETAGQTTLEQRRQLAAKVFARTAAYDAAIAAHLETAFGLTATTGVPGALRIQAPLAQVLRYGENPHQKAALYGGFHDSFQQLQGKELSYNNILDLTAAAALISEFAADPPTLAILKHTNPCGVGQGSSLREAWDKAFATDRQAPFGGIIAVNRALDLACAEAIAGIFSEVIVAPDFTAEALELLRQKKNLRILRNRESSFAAQACDVRSVGAGSYLWQERDLRVTTAADLKLVSRRPPTEAERQAMLFGWRIVKHVKSNAIIFVAADRTLGIGAGQMSRVDASRIAVWKAREAGLSLTGSVVCSDAFFPFPDGLIAAAEAGATAAIQPGGSVRDAEVIAAADERDVAMAFTGVRHFRH